MVIPFILIIMGAREPIMRLRIIMGTGHVVWLAAIIIMRWIVVIRAG